MKRKSRLGVIVRMARLEEKHRMRAFARVRRELEELDRSIAGARAGAEHTSSASCFSGHTSVSVDALQLTSRHGLYLAQRLSLLGHTRTGALERLEAARKALATARLRTRAIEDVERRRARSQTRALRKREARRLEETERQRMEASRANR